MNDIPDSDEWGAFEDIGWCLRLAFAVIGEPLLASLTVAALRPVCLVASAIVFALAGLLCAYLVGRCFTNNGRREQLRQRRTEVRIACCS